MMSLSYVYGVDGLQWENKKETEEKLVDFFFFLHWPNMVVKMCEKV